jgi:hypothetical protein
LIPRKVEKLSCGASGRVNTVRDCAGYWIARLSLVN